MKKSLLRLLVAVALFAGTTLVGVTSSSAAPAAPAVQSPSSWCWGGWCTKQNQYTNYQSYPVYGNTVLTPWTIASSYNVFKVSWVNVGNGRGELRLIRVSDGYTLFSTLAGHYLGFAEDCSIRVVDDNTYSPNSASGFAYPWAGFVRGTNPKDADNSGLVINGPNGVRYPNNCQIGVSNGGWFNILSQKHGEGWVTLHAYCGRLSSGGGC